MELGQYQIQILVSLVVMLGAAFVALICDFLKGHNEQLRELTIELKVRREEEQRRSQMMLAQKVAGADGPKIVNALPAPAAVRERMRMERVEQERIEQRTELPARASVSATGRESRDRKRPPSSDALAAMERGQALAASPRKRTAEPLAPKAAKVESKINVAPVTLVTRSSSGPKKDWGTLLSRKSAKPAQEETHTMEAKPDLLDAAVAATSNGSSAIEVVPAGFHDNYILSRLMQSRQPVSGLVVSIGVNTPRNADGSMPEQVCQLMKSLLGPSDFACQSSEEEFLLMFPNERGASAQRRLSEIAQQLWDFQLRSMGTFSILFSWGGVEVHSESIDEAIASANERMHETRRGRKLLTMEPRGEALRQAV
jgi:hypothetical protein